MVIVCDPSVHWQKKNAMSNLFSDGDARLERSSYLGPLTWKILGSFTGFPFLGVAMLRLLQLGCYTFQPGQHLRNVSKTVH